MYLGAQCFKSTIFYYIIVVCSSSSSSSSSSIFIDRPTPVRAYAASNYGGAPVPTLD